MPDLSSNKNGRDLPAMIERGVRIEVGVKANEIKIIFTPFSYTQFFILTNKENLERFNRGNDIFNWVISGVLPNDPK